ncbi:hypothetical protein UFOVP59_49 [uncultured Caudovirales phage]|uniref:Uncharacterized protein n=1 Tax=uncultured Caudovirales phage TaxID=2100421 RepID=A0A6J7WW01_9CAUD|nr:hypothetical protein UFOVP59_49 [uncultured Caudovirales phage]CAB5220988.1 hypothetical protein UFOVP246_66 [uncultured Caudovirales phage]
MTNTIDKFVEKVVVETTKIKKVVDGTLENLAFLSVFPKFDEKSIQLVVGAKWENECASNFTKNQLAELIEVLQVIHDAMKGAE